MIELLKKEEINTTRQINLDLLKAVAIIAMILCHAVMQFGAHIEGYTDDFAYVFGVDILGTYVAVAHAFMFCMGVGMAYSGKNTPKDLLTRGIRLYFLGYVLNFLRYSVYILGEGLLVGEFRSEFWYSLYTQDILHFAGIAMMVTALFKKMKLDSLRILLISAAMSALGSVIAFTSTGYIIPDILLGTFFTTTPTESCFTLLNWYILTAMGMVFGDVIRRIRNLDRFYTYTLLISGAVMIVYIALTGRFGLYFLTKERFYFSLSTIEALGFLSIDLFLAAVFYFLAKKVRAARLTVLVNMSKNVNSIYMIHWCIIGFMDCILCYLLGVVFPYWLSYLLGAVITAVSYGLSMAWKNRKSRSLSQ